MGTSLNSNDLERFIATLNNANQAFASRYTSTGTTRLPIHTLYGGAHLFKKDVVAKLAQIAQDHITSFALNAEALANALQIDDLTIMKAVYERVLLKLQTEAIEDQRIDFEDGYGVRSDDEEDGHTRGAARALAEGVNQGLLPPFIGIRIKAFSEEAKRRAIRTLDLFLTTYAETGLPLPQPFYVTLPKVTSTEQVAVLVDCIELMEERCGFPSGSIRIELMIETIQSLITPSGNIAIPALIDRGRGRVTSAILGTFDYTASCNIASHYQDHRHPSADFARQIMQVSLAGTPVNPCDGITNIMPTPVHRGANLTTEQVSENQCVVHEAWRIHFTNISHSLKLGFYQGWDLNPAQVPIRYASSYYFFLQGLSDAKARLKKFIDQATQASMVGNTFDDAASAQGLLNFFVNGMNCGAFTEEAVLQTGLTREELHGRSFQQIVKNRTKF